MYIYIYMHTYIYIYIYIHNHNYCHNICSLHPQLAAWARPPMSTQVLLLCLVCSGSGL